MTEDELAWMKRVGVHVKRATAGRRTFSPVEMLDKVAKWFAPSESSGLDTSAD